MTTKQSEEHFFHQRCKKTATNTNGFPILIGYLHRTSIWFSLFIGLFQRAKIHFSPPNSPFWPVKCATMPDKVIIDVLLTDWEARIGRNCARGLEYSRPRAQFLPIWTDLGRWITFLRMKATLGKNPIAAVTGRVDSLKSKTDFFFFSFFLL